MEKQFGSDEKQPQQPIQVKKRDYYEVMNVSKKATQDEIKLAYRKLALQYHPDKNTDENAKQIFQQLGEAYQCLSDPNERTWYDNHKAQILHNKMGQELSKEEMEEDMHGFDIWQYFSQSCYKGFNDDENGFYSVYRKVFELLKQSEKDAYDEKLDSSDEDEDIDEFTKLPGFGDSRTSPEQAADFFYMWGTQFVSHKHFKWADVYNPLEGENRWERRQIEKENRKARKTERQTYVQTVKQLVAYIKKRDPRYKAYQDEQREIEQKKEQEKQRIQQEKEELKRQQQKGKREAEQKRMQNQPPLQENDEEGLPQYADNIQKKLLECAYYCDVCNREYASQAQYDGHMGSKGHSLRVKKAMQEVASQQELDEVQREELRKKREEINQKCKDKRKNKKQKRKLKEASPNDQQSQPNGEMQQKLQQNESSESSEEDLNNNKNDDSEFFFASKFFTKAQQNVFLQQQEEANNIGKNGNQKNAIQSNNAQGRRDKRVQKNSNKQQIIKEDQNPKKNNKTKIKEETAKNKEEEGDIQDNEVQQNEQEQEEEFTVVSTGFKVNKRNKKQIFRQAAQIKTFQKIGNETLQPNLQKKPPNKKDLSSESENDEEKENNEQNIKQNIKQQKKIQQQDLINIEQKEVDEPVLNAAKIKKLKKLQKAEQEKQQKGDDFTVTLLKCGKCNQGFETKNKLHKHLKDSGHATVPKK